MKLQGVLFLLLVLPAGSVLALDDVSERAAPSFPGNQPAGRPAGPGIPTLPALSLEQQVSVLQQQVQQLQAHVAVLQTAVKVSQGAVTLQGTSLSLISSHDVAIQAGHSLTVHAAAALSMQSGTNTTIKAGATGVVESTGDMTVRGTLLRLNGGNTPMAMLGSAVTNGRIMTGSPTILGN